MPSSDWQAGQPQGKGGMPGWLIGVAIAVVIALVGGGFFLLSGDDGDDTAGDDTQTDTTDGDTGTTDTTEAEGAGFDPSRLTGTWEGTYECSRGPTGLRLWVDDYGDGTVGAAFDFYPLDENPDVEPGVFSLEGTYADGALDLEDIGWAEERQPDGYDSVGLTATVSDTDVMEVELKSDSCEPFTLERTTMEPWYVGTFEGVYGCTQGRTGMTIEIQAEEQDWARAFVEFYEVEDSTSEIPYGSFYLTGFYEDRSLYFTGGEWVERPENYSAVDMYSYDEAPVNPYLFRGFLDSEGCDIFGMERIEDDGEFGPGGSGGEGESEEGEGGGSEGEGESGGSEGEDGSSGGDSSA